MTYDERIISGHCLKVHCTKGQVGNDVELGGWTADYSLEVKRTALSGLVYVVDDDASFRSAVERRLKLAGYDVVLNASAQQLLEQLPGTIGRSCILLDVRIPGLSGPELQTRLGELGSMLPIVFLTGYAKTTLPERLQACPHLLKPYNPVILERELMRLMRAR